MSRFILIGGFIGFLVAFTAGISSGGSINVVLRDAMIGCLIVGIGFRIIYAQIQKCAIEILRREAEEQMAREQAEEG
jgi:hypothetical protein